MTKMSVNRHYNRSLNHCKIKKYSFRIIYKTTKQKSEKGNLINFCSSNALSDSDSLGGEGVGGQGGQGDEAEQGGGQREVGEQSQQPVEGEEGLEQDLKVCHFNSSGTAK